MDKETPDIESQLRQAIMEGKMSRYRLAKLTGVSQATLSLFVNGHHSITMETAAKLAAGLGLELRPVRKPRKKGG